MHLQVILPFALHIGNRNTEVQLQLGIGTSPQGRIHRIWSYNALDTALVSQSMDGIVMLSMTTHETVISSQL